MLHPDLPQNSPDVLAVGDLHGRYQNFRDALEALGCVGFDGDKLIWNGGDKTLLLHGDFLGDRNTDGIKILFAVKQLRDQGASVITLAGNHEEFFMGFLTGASISGSVGGGISRISEVHSQAKGLIELRNYFDIGVGSNNPQVSSLAPNVVHRVNTTDEGKDLMFELGKFQLVHLDVDKGIIFTHTPPTKAMIEALLYGAETKEDFIGNINDTNSIWQQGLRAHITAPDLDHSRNPYKKLTQVFLSTGNSYNNLERGGSGMEMMTDEQGIRLRAFGVSKIAHGHEDVDSRVISGITVESNDTSYGKKAKDFSDTQIDRLPIRVYSGTVISGTKTSVRATLQPNLTGTPEELIGGVRSFEELYKVLSSIGSIVGGRKTYSSVELINIIEEVRKKSKVIEYVTSTLELRNKVAELMKR